MSNGEDYQMNEKSIHNTNIPLRQLPLPTDEERNRTAMFPSTTTRRWPVTTKSQLPLLLQEDSNSVSVDCTITLRWQMQHRSNSNIILLTVTVIRASAFRIFRSSPLLSYVLLTRLSHAWAKKKKMVPRLSHDDCSVWKRHTNTVVAATKLHAHNQPRLFLLHTVRVSHAKPQRTQEIIVTQDDRESGYDWFNNTWRWLFLSTFCIFSLFLVFGNTLLSNHGLLERFEYW